MAKKNYTWKLEEELVAKIQQLAEKEHRSLTNYIEVMFIEKSQLVAVGGKKIKKKMRHNTIINRIDVFLARLQKQEAFAATPPIAKWIIRIAVLWAVADFLHFYFTH